VGFPAVLLAGFLLFPLRVAILSSGHDYKDIDSGFSLVHAVCAVGSANISSALNVKYRVVLILKVLSEK
jgi:hypothetical protein